MSSSVISAKGVPPLPRRPASDFFWISSKTLRELGTRLLDPKPDEAQRAAVVEDDDQDDTVRHQCDVQIVALTLVEVDREVLFAHQLGQPARRCDTARGQGSETRGVDASHLTGLADQLAVPIDDEHAFGVRIADEPLDHRKNVAEVLVVHHELCVVHPQMPR